LTTYHADNRYDIEHGIDRCNVIRNGIQNVILNKELTDMQVVYFSEIQNASYADLVGFKQEFQDWYCN